MPTPTVLITGGSSGIGLATAQVLHDRGYQVVVTGRHPDSISRARAELPAEVVVVRADARSLADTDRVVEEVRTRFGGLTTLFLNAGITAPTPVDTVDEATWTSCSRSTPRVSSSPCRRCCHCSPTGRQSPSPWASARPAGSSAAASPRPAAVPSSRWCRRWRWNWPHGGSASTRSARRHRHPIWSKFAMPADSVSAMLAAVAARNPFGRLGTAWEIAETVGFLAFDGAAYLTGQNLIVAGGGGLAP